MAAIDWANSEPMVVKQTSYATISIFEDRCIGMIQWTGKCTSEEYRSTFLYLAEVQKKYGIIRFLSDVREQAIITPEDRKWFEKEALPIAIDQGLKASAVVFNGNVFKKYYLNLILQAMNTFGLPLKLFNDLEPAEAWLMTKS